MGKVIGACADLVLTAESELNECLLCCLRAGRAGLTRRGSFSLGMLDRTIRLASFITELCLLPSYSPRSCSNPVRILFVPYPTASGETPPPQAPTDVTGPHRGWPPGGAAAAGGARTPGARAARGSLGRRAEPGYLAGGAFRTVPRVPSASPRISRIFNLD